jgi:hypothetical protein
LRWDRARSQDAQFQIVNFLGVPFDPATQFSHASLSRAAARAWKRKLPLTYIVPSPASQDIGINLMGPGHVAHGIASFKAL